MGLAPEIAENLNMYGIALFCVAGYLNGYLFRDVGFIKIVVIIFVVPFCLDFLIITDNLTEATLPFLLCAVIGFKGIEKSIRYLKQFYYGFMDLIGR